MKVALLELWRSNPTGVSRGCHPFKIRDKWVLTGGVEHEFMEDAFPTEVRIDPASHGLFAFDLGESEGASN